MNLDKVLYYKYLGVQLEARPMAHYFKEYESLLIKKAKGIWMLNELNHGHFRIRRKQHTHTHRTALPSKLYGMQK